MQKLITLLVLITMSCKGQNQKNESPQKFSFETIKTSDYELLKSENQTGLLILFPCFPCDAENTLKEFKIAEISLKNGFSVLAMNTNQRLYLNQTEKQDLSTQLVKIVEEQNLPSTNIFIGGFSSGGNVSLLIGDYLIEHNSNIKPKGIFVVDSPVDLLGLYKTAEKNLNLNFSEPSVAESKWIKEMLNNELGIPENGIANYELNSPYTLETQNIDNLKNLKELKIRFYTEPDLSWWSKHAKNDYKDLNAYYIQNLAERLKDEFGHKNIELITTKNQGYRANGERHPHSWSIVNEEDLIDWIKE